MAVTKGEGQMGDEVTIRLATEADRLAIDRLAQLDSRRALGARAVIAEMDGDLRAALDLDRNEAVADPFHPTAHLVALLELRAAQFGGRGRRLRGPTESRAGLGAI